jgi:hypothetical protein
MKRMIYDRQCSKWYRRKGPAPTNFRLDRDRGRNMMPMWATPKSHFTVPFQRRHELDEFGARSPSGKLLSGPRHIQLSVSGPGPIHVDPTFIGAGIGTHSMNSNTHLCHISPIQPHSYLLSLSPPGCGGIFKLILSFAKPTFVPAMAN